MIKRLSIGSLLAVLFFAVSGAAMTVNDLKCEYLVDPMGGDVLHPGLSWTLQASKRGQKQTAYEILAASSKARLDQNDGDLWDSGKIGSGKSVQVSYAGKKLRSCQQIFWKVRVWGADDNVTDWSSVATWTMGMLPGTDLQAKWISASGAAKYAVSYPGHEQTDFTHRAAFAKQYPNADKPGGPNFSSMLARRDFTVKAHLVRAVITISGLGQYELFVNGQKVGHAILSPGWTNYRKTVLYDTVDITRLLARGDNAIGIMLGNGMYNIQPDFQRYVKFLNTFGPLKTIAQLRLEYADGSVRTTGTDRTWQVAPGPVTFDNIYAGEDFDARLVEDGWDKPGFQMGGKWSGAIETSGPGGRLRGVSCAAPPIRAIAALKPVSVKRLNATTAVYDLGQNASIMPRLTVTGSAGSFIRIIPSELLKPDGSVDRTSATQDGVRPAWWQYTLKGGGPEHYFPHFFYQGGRYLQVERFPAKAGGPLPTIDLLEGIAVHSSSTPVGEFVCSNQLFNRIYQLVRWAQMNNMMSLMTDCPTREKLGWLEQDHLNGPALRYNFDMAPLFRKTMNDMADSQLANGFVPNIAPEYFIAGGPSLQNAFRNSPEWGGAFVLVAWQQYLFDGDVDLLRRHYAQMKRYVAFLAGTAKGDIVPTGLGDWCDLGPKPPWNSQLTPPPLTATAFYQHFNVILARIARLLGKPDEAKRFAGRAEKIRSAFNKTFYHPETHQYGTGSQCANALAVVMNLVQPADRAAVIRNIVADVRRKGLTAGDVGYRYLLRALADSGHSDIIYALNNQSDKPGYGYQLKMGATSLTEKWDASISGGFGSQDHFMLGQINEWFFHDLAGIQDDPAGPGFKKMIIKPAVVGDLKWVRANYNSVRGPVLVEWKRGTKTVTLNLTIPANTTATVYVPARSADSVSEGGVEASKSPDVRWLREDGGYSVFEVVSGSYRFVSRWRAGGN